MKVLFLSILSILGVVYYDTYLKGPFEYLSQNLRNFFIVATCIYLTYMYYQSPEDFTTALEMIKGLFLKPNNFKAKSNRQVGQLLKKKVAANQAWKCGHCQSILDASFEVDHIVALFRGGSNAESNLIALCRNCHGKKTVEERLL